MGGEYLFGFFHDRGTVFDLEKYQKLIKTFTYYWGLRKVSDKFTIELSDKPYENNVFAVFTTSEHSACRLDIPWNPTLYDFDTSEYMWRCSNIWDMSIRNLGLYGFIRRFHECLCEQFPEHFFLDINGWGDGDIVDMYPGKFLDHRKLTSTSQYY